MTEDENNSNPKFRRLCEQIRFENPKAVQFYGWDRRIEHYPFKIIGSDGHPTEYVAEFVPDFLVFHRFFSIWKDGELDDGSYVDKPQLVSADTRIIAALVNLAYPDGKNNEYADFGAIEDAIEQKIAIELPTDEEAEDILRRVNVVPFDNYALLKDNLSTLVNR